MENIERQQPKTRVEETKEVILNSLREIEEEFHRTANSWLACFESRIFVIETYLSGIKAKNELGFEKYKIVEDKIEKLKQIVFDLKQQYSNKNTTPPDEVKQELLEMLDVLK